MAHFLKKKLVEALEGGYTRSQKISFNVLWYVFGYLYPTRWFNKILYKIFQNSKNLPEAIFWRISEIVVREKRFQNVKLLEEIELELMS